MNLKIKYFHKNIDKIKQIPEGDWIDLRSAVDIDLKGGDFALIPLGVGMILPKGYEAHIVPRSSTFKNWGILQTNCIGIIDNSYSGDEDEWCMPVFATRDTHISMNDRICQFRLMKKMNEIKVEEVQKLNEKSRGGFGSTGTN